MRIGIDLSLAATQRAGVANYAVNLAKALTRVDAENEYLCYSHVNTFRINRHLWFQLVLPLLLVKDRVSLFHGTNFMSPLLCSVASVITIHDLSFMLYPETQTFLRRLNKKLVPRSIKKAKKIIVPSEAIKKEVLEYFGCSGDKVVVIYEGVGEEFNLIQDKQILSLLKQKYQLPEKFILYVGTLEPRKNIVKLIESFKLVKQKHKDIKLVLVGKKGWLYRNIFEKVKELGLEQDVIFTGYVPDGELPLIYNLAKVFVYPSLYEGFGLPILEAMACGIPVVTSNISSLPEVAQDAALLINPHAVNQIAEAVFKILENKQNSNHLIDRGFERVKMFSWDKCARETLRVYKSCL